MNSQIIQSKMSLSQCISIFLVCLLLAACDSNSENFTVEGVVTSSTGNAIFDAEVTVNSGTDVVESSATTPEGAYELGSIPEGSYELVVSREGYNTSVDSISVEGDMQRAVQLLGDANISGQVINSQTGFGLSEAEVNFYRGSTIAEADTSLPEFTVTTDVNGNYLIDNTATGTYICIIFAEDFIPQIIENLDLTIGSNDFGEVTAVEEVQEGELRIVLTWGESPDDLALISHKYFYNNFIKCC